MCMCVIVCVSVLHFGYSRLRLNAPAVLTNRFGFRVLTRWYGCWTSASRTTKWTVLDLYTLGIKWLIQVSNGIKVSCRRFDTSGSKSASFLVVALYLQPPKAKELEISAIVKRSRGKKLVVAGSCMILLVVLRYAEMCWDTVWPAFRPSGHCWCFHSQQSLGYARPPRSMRESPQAKLKAHRPWHHFNTKLIWPSTERENISQDMTTYPWQNIARHD